MQVKIASRDRALDEIDSMAETILKVKHDTLGIDHYAGTHFGEFCLLSHLGLRLDNAVAVEVTETYTFDKQDIWTLFRSMPYVERYRFILSLFTETGGVCYVDKVVPTDDDEGRFDGDSIKMLFAVACIVVEDVVDALEVEAESSDDGDGDGKVAAMVDNTELMERRKQRRILSVLSTFSSDVEDRMSSSNGWSTALMSFEKGKIRRRTSTAGVSRDDLVWLRRQSRDASVSGVGGIPSSLTTMGAIHAIMNNDSTSDEEKRNILTQHVRVLFLYMDKDQSGTIDRNELMLSLFDMGLEKSWDEVDDMISVADVDGDSMVSLDELVNVIMTELKNYNPSAPPSAHPSGTFG